MFGHEINSVTVINFFAGITDKEGRDAERGQIRYFCPGVVME